MPAGQRHCHARGEVGDGPRLRPRPRPRRRSGCAYASCSGARARLFDEMPIRHSPPPVRGRRQRGVLVCKRRASSATQHPEAAFLVRARACGRGRGELQLVSGRAGQRLWPRGAWHCHAHGRVCARASVWYCEAPANGGSKAGHGDRW